MEIEKELSVVYMTTKEALYKSKIVIAQYVALASGVFQQYGPTLIDAFNTNSIQVQSLVDSKIFGIISMVAAVATIFLKLKSTSLVKAE